jgi:hypothetical protein
MCLTRFQRFLQRLCIHVAHHQQFARGHVSGDGREQTAGVKFRGEVAAFFDLFDGATRSEWRSLSSFGILMRRGMRLRASAKGQGGRCVGRHLQQDGARLTGRAEHLHSFSTLRQGLAQSGVLGFALK